MRRLYESYLEEKPELDTLGRIPVHEFKNIVFFMAESGQIDWVEKFIKQYGDKVFPSEKMQGFLFGKGVIHFHREEWKDAIEQFGEVNRIYDDIFWGLDSRLFMVKAHYLLEEWEKLEKLLGAFRKFVDRKRTIPRDRSKKLETFIKLLNQVVKEKQKPSFQRGKEGFSTLLEEVIQKNTGGYLNWIIAMIRQELKA